MFGTAKEVFCNRHTFAVGAKRTDLTREGGMSTGRADGCAGMTDATVGWGGIALVGGMVSLGTFAGPSVEAGC